MPGSNNVVRMLDAKGISYTAFELPEKKVGALETAATLGVEPAQVFKTIVVFREEPKKPLLVLVPATAEVDLKKVALAMRDKRVTLATQRQAEEITGLQAGGISPLALLQRGFEVLIDESAGNFPQVHVSGGRLGLNLRVDVSDLVGLTRARMAAVARFPEAGASR
jgi:Cys-tRNA(Pro)/Cys-tRNA(Cys) deacylase